MDRSVPIEKKGRSCLQLKKWEKGVSVWLNEVFAKCMMKYANILLIADSHLKIHYDLSLFFNLNNCLFLHPEAERSKPKLPLKRGQGQETRQLFGELPLFSRQLYIGAIHKVSQHLFCIFWHPPPQYSHSFLPIDMLNKQDSDI